MLVKFSILPQYAKWGFLLVTNHFLKLISHLHSLELTLKMITIMIRGIPELNVKQGSTELGYLLG